MTAPVTTPRQTDASRSGGVLTGTLTLAGFMLRRDRIRIPLWLLGLTGATLGTIASLADLYQTAEERQTIAATMGSPAAVAMTGINHAPEDYTYGVMMGHQMLWFTAILVGLMSILLVVRHTRLEEATGRAELVRAGVVGRHASTAAAVLVVVGANLVLAVLLALSLGTSGYEGVTWEGSWLYGAAHAAVGLVFTGVAVVTVQVTEHSRGASGMAIAVIGLSYALRAAGDMGEGALSWLSPIGWAQATRVYADQRWWPLVLAVVVAALLMAGGVLLSTRRDVGAGLRRPRPGPPTASAFLASPFGFAWRLHRASLIGWCAALFLLGTMYGSILGDVEQMLSDVEGLEDFMAHLPGVDMTEAFAATITAVLAIIVGIYAALAALKMRTEESAGRAEPVLATALSRAAWVRSHLAVAMLGSALVLMSGGLGLGVLGAATLEDASLMPQLLGGALSYAPAHWIVIALVVALFGLLPRAIMLVWLLIVYSFVVVYLGGLLQFPAWMTNLSPFGHVPQLPAEDFQLTPLLVLAVIAGALATAGVTAFRRRDLQSST